jgi:hypothetical protein
VVNKHIKRLSTFSHQENECSHAGQNGYYKKKKKEKTWKWSSGCGGNGTYKQCWWGCNFVQPLSKSGGKVLIKLKIEL